MSRDAPETSSGRDRAVRTYEAAVDLEAEWLRYGAVNKVDSIETLLRDVGEKPMSLVELGCGTGAVIMECQRRGLARELTGIDYSHRAIEYLKTHSTGIHCVVADVMAPAYAADREFDVVVVSHVLEHLEEPLAFLQSLRSKLRFRYLVAEVPLEDLWASRLKNLVRNRSENAAGHVQFFTAESFEDLIRSAGFRIERRRHYAPVLSLEALELLASKERMSRLRGGLLRMSGHYLPRMTESWWKRYYYGHYAVLCPGE